MATTKKPAAKKAKATKAAPKAKATKAAPKAKAKAAPKASFAYSKSSKHKKEQ